MPKAARIFVSHNSYDAEWCHTFVALLRQAGADVWYDEHNLGLGQNLRGEIEHEIRTRPIFIVVWSPTARKSEWVNREIDAAIHWRDRDTTRIISLVAAKTCEIPALLSGLKHVYGPGASGLSPEEAVHQIIQKLALMHTSAIQASTPPAATETKEEALERAKGLYAQKRYEESLAAFDRADPQDAVAWNNRGTVFWALKRYEAALIAYDRALVLDPQFAVAWDNRINLLKHLRLKDDARIAEQQRAAALRSH